MSEPDSTAPRGRWFQFRLRTLLVLMAVLAIPLSWLSMRRIEVAREYDGIQTVHRLEGVIGFRLRPPPSSPTWLERIKQPFTSRQASAVWLSHSPTTDADLASIASLRHLEILDLYAAPITGPGLAHLPGLARLNDLNLARTQINDEALQHLASMTQLRNLNLTGTSITDAGLEHLQSLTDLRMLHLHKTKVTPAGMMRLQASLPACLIKD